MTSDSEYLTFIRDYYREKIEAFGATPQGVDWNGTDSQNLRFRIQYNLTKEVLTPESRILDYGCGYGEFAKFLLGENFSGSYTGYDIVEESLRIASSRFELENGINFVTSLDIGSQFDILFASGIFNVQTGESNEWLNAHVRRTLKEMSIYSSLLVVNFLKPNPTRPIANLFFPTIAAIASVLPAGFSISTVRDDYNLWEWTAVIRSGKGSH
jgi:ubiquinone/menaquinone biosynthesis C-methylase UbiE